MAQVRYLGIAVGEPVEPATLRSDPQLGLFVPATEPLPVGTQVDFDGAIVVVLRVEEGLAPGVWLRGDAVPRVSTDDVPTDDKPDGGERKRRRRAKTSVGR